MNQPKTRIKKRLFKILLAGFICSAAIVVIASLDNNKINDAQAQDCGECNGGVTTLTMQYLGDQSAEVIVYDKDNNIMFQDTVAPGGEFTFNGTEPDGTMTNEIYFYVDGVYNYPGHTSCSKPIGPGIYYGDFLVVSGESLNGGLLCPIECGECKGGVQMLKLEYTGDSAATVRVENDHGEILFEGSLSPGEEFQFYGRESDGTMTNSIYIYVDGVLDNSPHVSCSQPIGPGLPLSDNFMVIEGQSKDNGPLCPPEFVQPILECANDNGDGTYTAYFGYNSTYSTVINESAGGGDNKFIPDPKDRGQPSTFQPGRTDPFPNAEFSVVFDGNPIEWYFKSPSGVELSAYASSSSPACPDENIQLIATNIVCPSESILPNWGDGSIGEITSTTAADFLANNPECSLVSDQSYQWGYSTVTNPGDNTGEADPSTGWTTFGPTDGSGQAATIVPYDTNFDRIWVREIWDGNMIHFSGTTDNYSAELYCNSDIDLYDNYDSVISPQLGETYYCVSFNVIQYPPDAVNDYTETPMDTPVTVDVLNNDSDPDGTLDPSTLSVYRDPLNGTANVVGDQIEYTPNLGFYGDDSFEYEICDNDGLCDTATVFITILSPPDAVDDYLDLVKNVTVPLYVLSNDSDPDGILDVSTLDKVTDPSNGTIVIYNGQIDYTPNYDYYGPDQFDYEICDDDGLCDTATVYLNILSPPIANNDTKTVPQDTMTEIDVLDNDEDLDGTIDPTTLLVTVDPTHGTAIVNNGIVEYTPDPGYYGDDTFEYEVCDNDGLCDDAIVHVYVAAPPVAEDDTASTPMNTPVDIEVLNNDSDPDGALDVSSLAEHRPPDNGSITISNGVVEYTPNPYFYGTDTFEYQICDNDGLCDTATVTVTVQAPPIAEDDSEDTPMNTPVTVDVLNNDSDPDGTIDPTTLVEESPPSHGSITVVGGQIEYTPDPDYYGTDTFEYKICDNDGLCDTATVTINVQAPPIAEDDTESTPVNTPVTVDVLDNDSDPDGTLDPTTLTKETEPSHGTAIVNNGQIDYTPDQDYYGTDTFDYKICDNDGLCDTATVTITIKTPPIAEDDTDDTTMNTPVTTDVLNNDTDPDGALDVSSLVEERAPDHGSITVVGGQIEYTPDPDYYGTDTYEYKICDNDGLCDTATVTITIKAPPVAEDDDEETPMNTPVEIDVLANDSDPDGTIDPSTLTETTPPTHGSTSIVNDKFEYTPDPDYYGTDTFEYEICDNDSLCDTATVTIKILAPPVAEDDDESTPMNTPVTVDVLDNDSDPDGILDVNSLTKKSEPTHGTATVNNGKIDYSPDQDYYGTDKFDYEICDDDGLCDTATVTITIQAPPVAEDDTDDTPMNTPVTIDVLANDSDPDGTIDPTTLVEESPPSHGSITVVSGQIEYTPDTDYYGTDTFEYKVCDNDGLCDTATVTVTILAPPNAEDDSEDTPMNTPVEIDVLANDTDPDGTIDPSTLTETSPPSHGSTTIVNDKFEYTPDTDYYGTDTFEYEVCDNDGLCDTATVTVTIQAPPIAEDDTEDTPMNTPVEIDVLANDSDPDGTIDPTTLNEHSPPSNGTTTVVNDKIEYTPNQDYYGTDTFDYKVCDNDGLCDTATVTVNILAPPIANDDSTSTPAIPITIDVLNNDSDPDGTIDPTTLLITVDPPNGTATENNGQIDYTPDPGFYGDDTLTYEVCDNDGLCDTAVVTITVYSPPIAEDDEESTDVNTPVDVDVLANDSDPDGTLDITTLSIETPPSNGNAVPNGGQITYTPDTDYMGIDTFVYKICDNDGYCDTATVTIYVPEPEPPIAVDDEVTVISNETETIFVLTNDSDPDGFLVPTTVTIISPPSNGSASPNADGTITYTSDPDYYGPDTLTYQVCDNVGLCDTAIVFITVVAPPDAINDVVTTPTGTPTTIDPLGNDDDPDSTLDPGDLTIDIPPANGTAVYDPGTGIITYTPDPGFEGVDVIVYTICDEIPLCDTATIFIDVVPTPPPPPPPPPTPTPTPTPTGKLLDGFPLLGYYERDKTLIFGANEFVLPGHSSAISNQGVIYFTTGVPQTFYLEAQKATYATVTNLDTTPEESYLLRYDFDLKLWLGELVFDEPGTYRLEAQIGNVDDTYTREINTVSVNDPSTVVDADTNEPIEGAEIEIFRRDSYIGKFYPMTGNAYVEENPMTSDENGTFQIILQEGEYYYTVTAPGYKKYKSQIIVIEKKGLVTADILLEQQGTIGAIFSFVTNRFDSNNHFLLNVTEIDLEEGIMPIGEEVADISAIDVDDNLVTIVDYDDPFADTRPTFIYLYSKWNTEAEQQMEIIENMVSEWDDDYRFIALSTMDPPRKTKQALARGTYEIEFYQPTDAFYDDYMAISLPEFFIIDTDQTLADHMVGPQSLDKIEEFLQNNQ